MLDQTQLGRLRYISVSGDSSYLWAWCATLSCQKQMKKIMTYPDVKTLPKPYTHLSERRYIWTSISARRVELASRCPTISLLTQPPIPQPWFRSLAVEIPSSSYKKRLLILGKTIRRSNTTFFAFERTYQTRPHGFLKMISNIESPTCKRFIISPQTTWKVHVFRTSQCKVHLFRTSQILAVELSPYCT